MKRYLKMQGKITGWIDTEQKVYYSKRTTDHKFRIFGDGFGISVAILNHLQDNEIEKIIIFFERKVFESSVSQYFNYGRKYVNDDDKQLVLPLKRFSDLGMQQDKQKNLYGEKDEFSGEVPAKYY